MSEDVPMDMIDHFRRLETSLSEQSVEVVLTSNPP